MDTLKGVIFDHTTVLVSPQDTQLLAELNSLLTQLKGLGIKIIVFSTDPRGINQGLQSRGLPPADLCLCARDVGKKKGSPVWVQAVTDRLKIEPYRLCYIGDDRQDWLTAISAATFFLHAEWARPVPDDVTTCSVSRPAAVMFMISHLLLPAPRWEHTVDAPEYGLCLRCLLSASATLPASSPLGFTLQDIFTYENQVMVGENNARDVLMLHALSSLYLEGLLPPHSYFVVYPSSAPGKRNPVIEEFVHPMSRLFHGYYRDDLLVRAKAAPDTSLERVAAKREGRDAKVHFSTQANTVHVNPRYQRTLKRRTVVVFDNFTTSGKSLEWARSLLRVAGAQQVVLMTIGKYTGPHTIYVPKPGVRILPFELKDYEDSMFIKIPTRMSTKLAAQRVLRESFQRWKTGDFLPPGTY